MLTYSRSDVDEVRRQNWVLKLQTHDSCRSSVTLVLYEHCVSSRHQRVRVTSCTINTPRKTTITIYQSLRALIISTLQVYSAQNLTCVTENHSNEWVMFFWDQDQTNDILYLCSSCLRFTNRYNFVGVLNFLSIMTISIGIRDFFCMSTLLTTAN